MLSCSRGHAFAEKFCPGAGLLTTSKKFPRGGGGCWHLELTDALKYSKPEKLSVLNLMLDLKTYSSFCSELTLKPNISFLKQVAHILDVTLVACDFVFGHFEFL